MIGLPPAARLSREDADEPVWGVVEELLAQVIEEVGVLAAERRRKEMTVVPRPWDRKAAPAPAPEPEHGGTMVQGAPLSGFRDMVLAHQGYRPPPAGAGASDA